MSFAVDHEARRRLAELSRHFAAGLITNDEFVDQMPVSSELGIHDVYFYGLWPLHDDIITHRLRDKWALTPEGRAWVARIVLFLRTDTPYRYPIGTGLRALPILFLSLFTLGWFGSFWLRYQRRNGDPSVWPFFCLSEYDEAMRNPIYLNKPSDI